jgi:hypothetical protein
MPKGRIRRAPVNKKKRSTTLQLLAKAPLWRAIPEEGPPPPAENIELEEVELEEQLLADVLAKAVLRQRLLERIRRKARIQNLIGN